MSCDPEAHIMYGYYLGGQEGEWKIREVGDFGSPNVGWLGEDDDFSEALEAKLLEMVGFTETWETHPDTYYKHKREAESRLKVGVKCTGSDCNFDYTLYVKGSHEDIEWGATPVNLVVPDGADQALAEAIEYLGITPTQERPGWVLGALYF